MLYTNVYQNITMEKIEQIKMQTTLKNSTRYVEDCLDLFFIK
jgi:hypothetical protein